MTIAILSVSGAALAGVVATIGRASRLGSGRAKGGYNCCERCAAPLRRDAQQTWRYAGTCAECGFVQEWAPASRA